MKNKYFSFISFIIFLSSVSLANPFCIKASDKKLAEEFSLPQEICVDRAEFVSPEQSDEFVWVSLKGKPYSLEECWGRYMENEQGEIVVASIVDSRDHKCSGKIHTLIYLRLNDRGEYYGLESGKSYMESYTRPNDCPKLELKYQ